ncbi:hypothetical protein C0J52_00751 [Blattella germanica]|nr:hypothetical protein C0J52_00751 [Blattella germanica]
MFIKIAIPMERFLAHFTLKQGIVRMNKLESIEFSFIRERFVAYFAFKWSTGISLFMKINRFLPHFTFIIYNCTDFFKISFHKIGITNIFR